MSGFWEVIQIVKGGSNGVSNSINFYKKLLLMYNFLVVGTRSGFLQIITVNNIPFLPNWKLYVGIRI